MLDDIIIGFQMLDIFTNFYSNTWHFMFAGSILPSYPDMNALVKIDKYLEIEGYNKL